jgi:hypothetical protein
VDRQTPDVFLTIIKLIDLSIIVFPQLPQPDGKEGQSFSRGNLSKAAKSSYPIAGVLNCVTRGCVQ